MDNNSKKKVDKNKKEESNKKISKTVDNSLTTKQKSTKDVETKTNNVSQKSNVNVKAVKEIKNEVQGDKNKINDSNKVNNTNLKNKDNKATTVINTNLKNKDNSKDNKATTVTNLKDNKAITVTNKTQKVVKAKNKNVSNITVFANVANVKREWLLIDAQGMPLGRLASQVALLLRGKHKAIYTPNVDVGDFVIIINSDKVVLTGKKLINKTHKRHTLYPGGLKEKLYKDMMAKESDEVVKLAVKGMLPKNILGKNQFSKLKVFKNSEHPHAAQNPREYKLIRRY